MATRKEITQTIIGANSQSRRMKLCPQCKLLLTNAVLRCDCGYSFPDDRPVVPALPEPAPHSPQHSAGLAVPTTPRQTEFLDMTWERVLAMWWSLAWRGTVFGMLLSLFLGFCGGFLVGFAGHPELGPAVGLILSWLGSMPLSVVLLRIVLSKKFPEFSVRLVRNTSLG